MALPIFLDAIDLAAAREGSAIREFRKEYTLTRCVTRANAKRGTVRGSLGAKQRRGLILVTPPKVTA